MLATLVNALYFAGLTIAVGAVALRYLVMTRSGLAISERAPALRDAAKYGLGGAAAVLVAAPLRVLVQAQGLAFPGDALLPLMRTVITTSELGRALLLQAIWAAAAMAAFSVARLGPQRGWSAAAITVMILALGPALTGHAAAADPLLPAQVSSVAHALAAGAWIGTLFHLWRIARKASDATLKRLFIAFHAVALSSATVLALSGAYQAWSIVEMPSQLWTSWWGRFLIMKLAALGVVMGLGYRHWKAGEALIASGDRTTLRESMKRELWAAAVVLLVTGMLTSTGLE
jgi:putative copper export protein